MILERESTWYRVNRKERPSFSPRCNNRQPLSILVKVLLLITLLGTAACNSGTGSTTSAGATGSGGNGVGWQVNVKVFAGTLSLTKSETTSVVVTVKDAAGGAAPRGTRICLSTTHGLIFVDELGRTEPVVTGCVSTSNDIGQLMGTYQPLRVGVDQVQASAMGAFGSAAVQITD
ncbi:MAG: hypothetical protein HY892_16785 [Deltaproteobacteria bacterium]|nr:hypothetical protein [Deltaproteobacteria bacterium]